MRKLITIGLLLISSLSFAQTWQGGLSNVIQRQPTDTGFNYRISLGSGKGVLNLTSKERIDSLFTSTKLPVGLRGQQLKVDSQNTNVYTPQEPLIYGQFVYTDAQLTRALAAGSATQQKIFNTWKRFSHGGDPNPANPVGSGVNNNLPGQPSQVASWNFDTATGTINSTFNTGSVLGFVSNQDAIFDTYTHTATLSSTDADNDQIGLVLAFTEDASDPQTNRAYHMNLPGVDTSHLTIPNQHSLILFRNRNGATNSYFIAYDYSKLTQVVVANGSSLANLFSTTAGWSGNSVDVKVVRTGDLFTVTTSQFSDASGGKGSLGFTLTLNLNSNPVLAKFKGKQPYGYAVRSQANSKFTNVFFSGSTNIIYDLRNGNTYPYINNAYVLDTTKNMYTDLGTRFFWRNTTEGSYGYIQPSNTFDVINTSQYDGIPVKSPNGTVYRIIVANDGTLSTATP